MKAAEDSRTPKPCGRSSVPKNALASWSAAVPGRFPAYLELVHLALAFRRFSWGGKNRLVRLAAINLLIGPAKRAEPLEGLYHPERKAGLLSPGALADDTIHTTLGQRSCSLGEDRFVHKGLVLSWLLPVHVELHVD